MADVDRLAVWLRDAMDAAWRDAEEATPGPWEPEGDDPTDDEVHTVHDGKHGDLVGNTVAFARGGWGGDPGTQVANMRHIARHDPTAVLRRITADRKTLEWCTEVIGETDLSNYGETGSLRDHPQALAVTLAVETIRNLAEGYGWKESQ